MPTFRIKEAADLLGVSNDTLYRWVEAGRITAADDPSGVMAVDGAALATLAQELAESVAGEYQAADGTFHGYLWQQGRFRTLPTPGTATGINNRGQITGPAGDNTTTDG